MILFAYYIDKSLAFTADLLYILRNRDVITVEFSPSSFSTINMNEEVFLFYSTK